MSRSIAHDAARALTQSLAQGSAQGLAQEGGRRWRAGLFFLLAYGMVAGVVLFATP